MSDDFAYGEYVYGVIIGLLAASLSNHFYPSVNLFWLTAAFGIFFALIYFLFKPK